MKPNLTWTPQARADLIDIYIAIAGENATAADRLWTTIESRVQLLATQPRLGKRRPDIAPSARALVMRPYLVLYKTHPDTDAGPVNEVEFVRIVHGRRELMRVF